MNTLTRYTLSAVLLMSTCVINAADNVITISSKDQFDREILKSGRPAVVKVGAKWCSACVQSEKPYHKLSNDYSDIIFASVDFDQNGWVANSPYNVQSLPTLLYFNNGKLVTSRAGYSKDEVTRTLGSMKSSPAAAPVEKKSPQEEQAQVSEPAKELAPEAALEPTKAETEMPACLAQSESFFERAYNATRDFFANLGNTIRGWFK